MKKAADIFKKTFFLICCFFFCLSCGLEEVTVVDELTVTYNDPLYSDSDYTNYYCEFLTNEKNQLDSFIGTEIYYKIYNNSSALVSERNSIKSVNTSSYGSAAAERMINNDYQVMGANPKNSGAVFIPTTGNNRKVYFRPADNGDGDNLKADIRISGTSTGQIPYRYNDKSFDFFDNDNSDSSDTIDVEPVYGDDDYRYSSSASSSTEYYVQFFAVGVAWNSNSSTRSYSLLLDLGSIPIKKTKD